MLPICEDPDNGLHALDRPGIMEFAFPCESLILKVVYAALEEANLILVHDFERIR